MGRSVVSQTLPGEHQNSRKMKNLISPITVPGVAVATQLNTKGKKNTHHTHHGLNHQIHQKNI